MKTLLKKIIFTMREWPIIGYFVKLATAILLLPKSRDAYLNLNHKMHVFETEHLPMLLRINHEIHIFETEHLPLLLGLNHTVHIFESQQLPNLLQTVSDINQRQLSNDNDQTNLINSVPVSLRKITRDLLDIQAKHCTLADSLDQKIREAQERRTATPRSMEQWVKESQESLSKSVDYLSERVEFVRRELMFEMQYSDSSLPSNKEQLKTEVEILSPEKLADARSNTLKLNIGCGHIPREGYINIDRRALPGVDIVAEADDLPFKSGEIDVISSAHLLEHFPQEQLRRELLPHFFNLLKEGGQFEAVVPDVEAMIQKYSNGSYSYDDMREVIYGAQDYTGDYHFNMFTPESLAKLLEEAGFSDIDIVASARKNGKCLEFEIKAFRKSGDKYD